jgi:hypothetical protein
MSLPTYESTVKGPNKLTFVAPYLGRSSLLAASLACKEWYSIFAAQLWSDPIKLAADTRNPFGKDSLPFTAFADTLHSQHPSFLHPLEYSSRISS